ncbi:hypothetical protein Daci_4694 [Delftia acidovorans SPH-1]|uniref:Uncharacterized protein n=2 Tax=Delftia acidovorans TaxID=80866 RepID=A9C3L2_DELAS|nr:hypothetical protein Daci_4694 [Delftia acidovorans SPH-1]
MARIEWELELPAGSFWFPPCGETWLEDDRWHGGSALPPDSEISLAASGCPLNESRGHSPCVARRNARLDSACSRALRSGSDTASERSHSARAWHRNSSRRSSSSMGTSLQQQTQSPASHHQIKNQIHYGLASRAPRELSACQPNSPTAYTKSADHQGKPKVGTHHSLSIKSVLRQEWPGIWEASRPKKLTRKIH